MKKVTTTIVLTKIVIPNHVPREGTECYSTMEKACKAHGWKVTHLPSNRLPMVKDDWFVQRIEMNAK